MNLSMRIRWLTATALAAIGVTATGSAQSVRVTESIQVLEQRAASDSNDAAAHYNLAMGYWSKKRYADAEHSLRQSVAIEPQFADAWLALAIVHNWDTHYWKDIRDRGGDTLVVTTWKEWDGYYRRAFLIDPLVDIKILGATWRLGFGSWHDFSDGLRDLIEGRYQPAYDHFSGAVRYVQGSMPLDSVDDGLLWFQGLAAAHVEQYDVAMTDFTSLLGRVTVRADRDSSDEIPLEANDYRYMLAMLNQKTGKTDEALRLYQQVLENDIGNYMAHVQMARIYEGARRFDLAVIERQRAVETNAEDASLLLDLGITLGRAGHFDEALDVLQRAVEMNPRDTRSLFWLGTAALQLQKRDQAKDAFSRFVAQAPRRYDRQLATARQKLSELQ
jgi:Tfp pilus assembly protein PilF